MGHLPRRTASAEQYVERLEALGARVVETAIPEPPGDTWPLFFHEAAESHRATFPSRADEYGDNVRAKLEQAQTVEQRDADLARESVRRWREYVPDVDLYVAPTLGVEIPPEDCDELEIRIPATAFLRPFNVLGWAGARDRRPAARRAARRGRPRRRARLGARRRLAVRLSSRTRITHGTNPSASVTRASHADRPIQARRLQVVSV